MSTNGERRRRSRTGQRSWGGQAATVRRQREEARRRRQRSWGGQAETVRRQRTRGGQAATPAIVRRPSSYAQRCEGRGKRPPVNRMRWPAVGPRSATSGCVRARTRAHATRVHNDNVGLRTFINRVGWTHPHPLRYCWMHANLSILYFCIIAFNCFPGNKCCLLPCRLSRESFHRVKEPKHVVNAE